MHLVFQRLIREVSVWKHRASAQGCCDECFCVKGCRFIFVFHYLWVSVSCFFLIRISVELKFLQECLDDALRHRVGFSGLSCAGSGVGLDDPCRVSSNSINSVIVTESSF